MFGKVAVIVHSTYFIVLVVYLLFLIYVFDGHAMKKIHWCGINEFYRP